jgi:hypothetical protein
VVVGEECVVSNLVGEIKEEQQRRTNNKQQTKQNNKHAAGKQTKRNSAEHSRRGENGTGKKNKKNAKIGECSARWAGKRRKRGQRPEQAMSGWLCN